MNANSLFNWLGLVVFLYIISIVVSPKSQAPQILGTGLKGLEGLLSGAKN